MLNSAKQKMMFYSRLKKYEDFLLRLSLDDASTILDVGVADKEWSAHVNFLEKKYPLKTKITALSVQELKEFQKRYPEIKTVTYEGGVFPFTDKQFTAVHSNAVVEHVGSRGKQVEFVRELARCGERFFFSTPAKEFFIEMHTNMMFLHWLPKSVFDRILRGTGKAWATGDYMNLLTRKSLVKLMASAEVDDYRIITYRLFFFPYQYVVYGPS